MKTYTQKQYNSAKERAYKKGYKARILDEAPRMDEVLENAQQAKGWLGRDLNKIVNVLVVLVIISIVAFVFLSAQAEAINNLTWNI